MKPLKNKRHEMFAQGIASGLNGSQAYIKAGFSKNGATASASRLLMNADVKARIAYISDKIAHRAVETLAFTPIEIEIANRNKRVARLNERAAKLDAVIRARAEAYAGKKGAAPGAETGMMVHRLRAVGHGQGMRLVGEWEVDTALLREMRGIEQQAAQELGQWTEKREITERPSVVRYGWVSETPKQIEARHDRAATVEAEFSDVSSGDNVN